MKKLVCLLLVCSIAGTSFASKSGGGKKPPPGNLNNPSITKSRKAMNRQDREFATAKYSSTVNGNRISRAQKRAAKKQAARKE